MLRFATGVLKNRPLEYVGPFKIIKWRGEEVAMFKGGQMARFYDDGIPEVPTSGATPDQVEARLCREAAAMAEVAKPQMTPSPAPESSLIKTEPQKQPRWRYQFSLFGFAVTLNIEKGI